MKIIAVPSLITGVISITIGLFYFSFFYKKRGDNHHFSFFRLSLAIAFYQFASSALYNSNSVIEGAHWQKYQFFLISIIAITFILFIFDLTKKTINKMQIFLLILIYFPIGIVSLLTDYAINSKVSAIKNIPYFNIRYYEAEPEILALVIYILLFSSMIYSYYLLIENYKKGFHDIQIVIIAISLFFLASINDILVGVGAYKFIYLVEYGFIIVIVSMSILQHNRFVKLYNSTEQKAKNLEIIIEEKILELKKAVKLAQESDKSKSIFLSSMSHEIRTPMNGIIGMTQLLINTNLNDEQVDYVKTINNCSEDLLQIINDILDYSKISENKIELNVNSFSLHDSINHVVKLMDPLAKNKDIYLNYSISSNFPAIILGDEIRLRQVLLNLIGNSIKFTKKGNIELNVSHKHEQEKIIIQFSISDTGIGIQKSQLENLFDPFVQANKGIERKYGGTGLGLAISSRLISLMDGQIWVKSKLGKGSTFYFTVKVKPSNTKEPKETTRKYYQNNFPLNKNLKILLVEDNEINTKIAIKIFEKLGYQIDHVVNGMEALEHVKKINYDIIFMDIHMPNMNGITATEKILENNKNNNPPKIIAMTADVFEENINKYKRIGMVDYIGKPFQNDELEKKIRKWGSK